MQDDIVTVRGDVTRARKRTSVPAPVICTDENVATPATAVAVGVPATFPELPASLEMTTVDVEIVPVLTAAPLPSSI